MKIVSRPKEHRDAQRTWRRPSGCRLGTHPIWCRWWNWWARRELQVTRSAERRRFTNPLGRRQLSCGARSTGSFSIASRGRCSPKRSGSRARDMRRGGSRQDAKGRARLALIVPGSFRNDRTQRSGWYPGLLRALWSESQPAEHCRSRHLSRHESRAHSIAIATAQLGSDRHSNALARSQARRTQSAQALTDALDLETRAIGEPSQLKL
jgi:hypothetical protein